MSSPRKHLGKHSHHNYLLIIFLKSVKHSLQERPLVLAKRVRIQRPPKATMFVTCNYHRTILQLSYNYLATINYHAAIL